MKKYSVLTCNLGGYDLVYEIPQKAINDEIEYVYVTDDNSIKSETWRVVYENNLVGDNFDKCYQIKYDPFKYVSTDVVLVIDGSIEIIKDVMPIFELFDKYGYDAAVVPHYIRNNIVEEYDEWIAKRGYTAEQKEKCLEFIKNIGYDLDYKGLYEGGLTIKRNNSVCRSWCTITYNFLKVLATPPNTIERIEQIISSVVLNKFFSDKNIMPISPYIYASSENSDTYFKLHSHGSYDYSFALHETPLYLFNKLLIFN